MIYVGIVLLWLLAGVSLAAAQGPLEFYGDERYAPRSPDNIFRGPRKDAIERLGSNHLKTALSGYNRLVLDGKEAIPDLKASIAETLWLDATQPSRTFARQDNAIRMLALLEKYRSDGVVVELIDDVLTQAEQGATFPKQREVLDERADWRFYNALDDSSNHSLAWLLTQLEPADVARLYGERLLRLRDHASYGWKDDAQFVLDACHVEDHLERAEAERQTLTLKPVRCESPYPGATKPLDIKDWEERLLVDLRFSPDGARVTGTTSRGVTFTWMADTGKLVEHGAVSLESLKRDLRRGNAPMQSVDGKWWSIEPGESRLYLPARFFDVFVSDEEPKRDESELRPQPTSSVATLLGRVSPRWDQEEPRGLVRGNEFFHVGTQIYSRRDLQLVSAVNVGGHTTRMRFSGDGERYLVTSQRFDQRTGKFQGPHRQSNWGVKRLRVQELRSGRTLFCLQLGEEANGVIAMDLSPDGKKLVFAGDDVEVEVWPVGKQ